MCILFIYRNPDADASTYRLIIASNRDEILHRPTKAAHFWEDQEDCIGGLDQEPMKEGGTWLALSKKKARVGIILNLAEVQDENMLNTPVPTHKKGRGYLIRNLITSDEPTLKHFNKLDEENRNTQPYNPYTLVSVDIKDMTVSYLTSSENSRGPITCEESILGFSNSVFERPYKKVTAGLRKFETIVKNVTISEQDQLITKLLEFLKSRDRHLPDKELKSAYPKMYKVLSSIFVDGSEDHNYGTRTHTLILVTGSNKLTFIENTRNDDGTWSQQDFEMEMEN